MPAATRVVLTLDLSPVPINICIARRDSFVYGFLVEDADGTIDFTGSTFLHATNPAVDGSGVDLFEIAEFNTPDATGLVQFKPSVADLTQVPASYFHDIQWTDAAGNVRTIIAGTYEIGPDIAG